MSDCVVPSMYDISKLCFFFGGGGPSNSRSWGRTGSAEDSGNLDELDGLLRGVHFFDLEGCELRGFARACGIEGRGVVAVL